MAFLVSDLNDDWSQKHINKGTSADAFCTYGEVEKGDAKTKPKIGAMDTHSHTTPTRSSQSYFDGDSHPKNSNTQSSPEQLFTTTTPISSRPEFKLQIESEIMDIQPSDPYTTFEPWGFDLDVPFLSTEQSPRRDVTPPPEDWLDERFEPEVPKQQSSILQLLASQRQLLADYTHPHDDTPMANNPLDHYIEDRGNIPSHISDKKKEVVDSDVIDQAMGNHDEDAEWMENDAGPAKEYEELIERIEVLERRQANGKITGLENDELIKAQREMSTWNRLTNMNSAQDSLFIEDSPAEAHRFPTNTLGTWGVSRKGGHSRSKIDTRLKTSTKKAKNGNSAKSITKQKGKEKARRGGNSAAKNTTASMIQRPDRLFEGDLMSSFINHDTTNETILNHLAHNNPIDDFHSNAARKHGPGPEINTRNKKTQLEQIFAAIPAGGNARTEKADRAKLNKACVSFGCAKVKAVDGKWKVRGMNSSLYHHQLLGAHWMVEREMSEEQPHGGLLADSMGLGKTVEAIACMVANPPQTADLIRGVKATLIVVPASVINQWHREIEIHSSRGSLDHIMVYKNTTMSSVQSLSAMDVVLCSYQEVMRQFPFPGSQERGDMEQTGHPEWLKINGLELGLLHQVDWYRIILDEAHFIKNYTSRTSLACQNLKAIYRWCLTGTPLMNGIEELYPYLCFLRANVGIDRQSFIKNFCNFRDPGCKTRVNVLLTLAMLRRTMNSTLLNRPLINLPNPEAKIEYVEFSDEERIIYRITENRFRAGLNTHIAKGDLRQNYAVFFVQLLRLRQCTSHPFMLERTIKESWTVEDVRELKRKLKEINSRTSRPFYERTKLWVGGRSSTPNPTDGDKGDGDGEGTSMGTSSGPSVVMRENRPFGRGDMGTLFSMDRVLGTLKKKDSANPVQCGLCGDFVHDPLEIDCKHSFCRACLEEHMHRQASQASDDPVYTCPTCYLMFSDLPPVDDNADSELNDDGTPTKAAQDRGQKRIPANSKGRDFMGFEPYTTHSSWLQASDGEDGSCPLTSSAKVTALKAHLLHAFEKNPMEKVVVFVQFRLLARIIGRLCNQENWGFLYYTGDQSPQHRDKAIVELKSNPDIRILISGLKCGGLGLNLTMASRCVSLDLWWNHAVEQQAFGRIFRIGQERPTTMTRLVVKDTVDMRMLRMQAHKLKVVESTMADHRAGPGGSLGAEEFASLFGFVKTDADGKIIGIESDYKDNR